MNCIWQELGAAQDRRFIQHDVYQRVEGSRRPGLDHLYESRSTGAAHEGVGPADAGVIEEFCNSARRFSQFVEVIGDPCGPSGLLDGIKMGVRMLHSGNLAQI